MHRLRSSFFLLGIALMLGALACVPVYVNNSCRKLMDDCLRNCQRVKLPSLHSQGPNDSRNACEVQCHQLCRNGKLR